MLPLKKFLPSTLRSQFIVALFSIGFFPYLAILVYNYHLGEKKILDQALSTYQNRMLQSGKSLEEQLVALQKELHFLSSLEIMNDMIIGDVDKRINQILMQKQKDLALDVRLFALDKALKVYASTDQHILDHFPYNSQCHQALDQNRAYFFTDHALIYFTPIYSSLQKEQLIGYLGMEYQFSNFDRYLLRNKGDQTIFYYPPNDIVVGENIPKDLIHRVIQHLSIPLMDEKFMTLSHPLTGILSKWVMVYRIKTSVALGILDGFIVLIWALLILGVLVIALISLWMGHRILTPIAKLSEATQSIISTQDYTTQVHLHTEGEIKELTNHFNTLVLTVHEAILKLEAENQHRLLRFTQLVTLFNRLIETKDEKECITLAMKELGHFMPDQHFNFSDHFPQTQTKRHNGLLLYIQNYENNSSDFYGVIFVDKQQEEDHYEEEFYQAISQMIMLQLNHIRLVEKIQNVSQAKSTFISHMSHELRTPLHTILSTTQYLIAYEKLTHPQQEMTQTIESSANHLLGIINDILDLVKIEAGGVAVTPKWVSIKALFSRTQEVVHMLEVLADQKAIDITLKSTVAREYLVKLDEKFFKQIVINLLSNAIKFTPNGTIECLIELSQNSVRLMIEDSGIGLSREDLSLVFGEFIQAKQKQHSKEKGSGLGLTISQKLAQLFGAHITLESEGSGKGVVASIWFTSREGNET